MANETSMWHDEAQEIGPYKHKRVVSHLDAREGSV